jgi:hypothetical protein
MCNHLRSVSKLALGLTSLGLVFTVALIAGCDSSGDPTSPEAQKQASATAETINKTDQAASDQIKKKGGKNAPELRSNFKGGKGAGVAPAGDAKPAQ